MSGSTSQRDGDSEVSSPDDSGEDGKFSSLMKHWSIILCFVILSLRTLASEELVKRFADVVRPQGEEIINT